jgi:hypothetical protein
LRLCVGRIEIARERRIPASTASRTRNLGIFPASQERFSALAPMTQGMSWSWRSEDADPTTPESEETHPMAKKKAKKVAKRTAKRGAKRTAKRGAKKAGKRTAKRAGKRASKKRSTKRRTKRASKAAAAPAM